MCTTFCRPMRRDYMKYESDRRYEIRAATTADEIEQLRPFWARLSSHLGGDIDFLFAGRRDATRWAEALYFGCDREWRI
jgi:hypothetical protein